MGNARVSRLLGLRAKVGWCSHGDGFHFDPETGRFEAIADPSRRRPASTTASLIGKAASGQVRWCRDVPGSSARSTGWMQTSPCIVIEGVGCSNGRLERMQTMYFSDSHSGRVDAYDFDPATGDVENRRIFIDMTVTGGVADGATVDAEGCYWVTIPVTSKVCRYDPDGKLMRTIVLPTDLPTCCEFGGKDLDILYVTTAVLKRPAEHFAGQKNPGGLFAIDAGVKGLTLPAFAG